MYAPRNPFMINVILNLLKSIEGNHVTKNDISDYNKVYKYLSSPSKRYGSGSHISDFIDNYYDKIKLEIGTDKEQIEDFFNDLLPKYKIKVITEPNGSTDKFTVVIMLVNKTDIPDVIKILLDMKLSKEYINSLSNNIIIQNPQANSVTIKVEIHKFS
jgi:hypothetical protein